MNLFGKYQKFKINGSHILWKVNKLYVNKLYINKLYINKSYINKL